MNVMDGALASVDFNHLRALHVLLDEANVGRAAARLNVTPPAASNALRRLRDLLGDPLLVRSGRTMVRTSLGEALRAPAADFVRAASALLQQRRAGFTPATWRGTFSLLTSGYVYLALADRLEPILRERVPGLDLDIQTVGDDDAEWLRRHEGLAITPITVPHSDVISESLFRDEMVLAMRADHALANKRVTLKRFCELDHVLVSLRSRPGGVVDSALTQLGRSRRVARVVPSHVLAAHLVASSDYVSTFPARLVDSLGERYGIVGRSLPIELPGFEFRVSWHRRHDASPIHAFVRALLQEVAE